MKAANELARKAVVGVEIFWAPCHQEAHPESHLKQDGLVAANGPGFVDY